MVSLTTPALKKMHNVPDGAFSVKLMAGAIQADAATQSNVYRVGYGGAGALSMVVATTVGAIPTSLDVWLQGRADEDMPWVDLLQIVHGDMTLGGNKVAVNRMGSGATITGVPHEGMVWPEIRISLDALATTTPATDAIDVWVMGCPDGAR